MSNKLTTATSILAIVISVIVGFVAIFGGKEQTKSDRVKDLSLGGTVSTIPIENYDPYVRYNGGLYTELPSTFASTTNIGTTGGSNLSLVKVGTCTIAAVKATSAAYVLGGNEVRTMDCGAGVSGSSGKTAISGIQPGDIVDLHLATTTPVAQNSLSILSAAASSTAGFITAQFFNASSSIITLTSSATTSLQYKVFRDTAVNGAISN